MSFLTEEEMKVPEVWSVNWKQRTRRFKNVLKLTDRAPVSGLEKDVIANAE